MGRACEQLCQQESIVGLRWSHSMDALSLPSPTVRNRTATLTDANAYVGTYMI